MSSVSITSRPIVVATPGTRHVGVFGAAYVQ